MAKITNMQDYKYVTDKYKSAANIAEDFERFNKDGRAGIGSAAESRLRDIAFKKGKDSGRITDPAINKDNLAIDHVQKYIQEARQEQIYAAQNRFYENLEDIVDNQMPESVLENLAFDEKFVPLSEGDNRKAIALYGNYKQLEDFAKHYQKNKSVRTKEEEALLKQASKEAEKLEYAKVEAEVREKEIARQKSEGYGKTDERLVRYSVGLAREALAEELIQPTDIEKYISDGINGLVDQAKKSYEEVEVTVHDAVRNTLKKSGASDSTAEFNAAFEGLYRAAA